MLKVGNHSVGIQAPPNTSYLTESLFFPTPTPICNNNKIKSIAQNGRLKHCKCLFLA